MSSLHQHEDVGQAAIDLGYKTVRSYSSTFHIHPDSHDGMLSIQITMALLKINAGCQRYIVEYADEEVEDVYTSIEGRILKYGTTKGGKGSIDSIVEHGKTTMMTKIMMKNTSCLPNSFSGKAGLQISRIGIAWWTDQNGLRKTIRIFGDRIRLTEDFISVPAMSCPIDTYNLVYPESEAHPDHCSKCRRRLKTRNSDTKEFLQGVHLDNPPRFLCEICKYQLDTGFLPVSRRK